MHNIVLADNQELFSAGVARVVAMERDLRIIAQCPIRPRLYLALKVFPGAIFIVASSMQPDPLQIIAGIRSAASRLILVAENDETPLQAVLAGLNGLIYRNASNIVLLETVRRVIRGERSVQPVEADPVGARVHASLSPRELKIVALIIQGCKNREIGRRLGTTEQVIKNCLLNIYDKTGVSDRLELALFTTHHRALADAANEASNLMELSA
jgi:DNA-binding NarL/FixJ family response regulator